MDYVCVTTGEMAQKKSRKGRKGMKHEGAKEIIPRLTSMQFLTD
jgi:superfamily II RNA helicase